jgi:elongation factor P
MQLLKYSIRVDVRSGPRRAGRRRLFVASIEYVDVRKGMVLVGDDGQLYQCLDRDLNTPGNWRAILQLKLKNLKTGSITMNRVRPQDKVEVAYLEKKDFQYLYQEGEDYIFMDTETYDQFPLPEDLLGDQMKYLKENDTVKLTMYEGKPLDIELPATVDLKVVETEPSVKGATAAAQYKPAIMETGLKVTVPPFIGVGDVLSIDTRTGEYLSRAK